MPVDCEIGIGDAGRGVKQLGAGRQVHEHVGATVRRACFYQHQAAKSDLERLLVVTIRSVNQLARGLPYAASVPRACSNLDRIDPGLLPPGGFIARCTNR
jgi:hypothetical protein